MSSYWLPGWNLIGARKRCLSTDILYLLGLVFLCLRSSKEGVPASLAGMFQDYKFCKTAI